MRRLILLIFSGVLLFSPDLSAQTLNPTHVEFTASPDHAATIGTQAIVTKYELLVVRQSAPTTPVVPVVDLGKPTPSAGAITVPVPGGLPNNTLLQVSIRTVGPGGTTASALSDPFAVAGPPAAAGKPVLKTN